MNVIFLLSFALLLADKTYNLHIDNIIIVNKL